MEEDFTEEEHRDYGFDGVIDALTEYAELSCDENGELASCLINLYQHKDDISKELRDALMDEISSQLKFFTVNFRIVEGEYITTYKELEWIDDEYL